MKHFILFSLIFILVFACKQEDDEEEETVTYGAGDIILEGGEFIKRDEFDSTSGEPKAIVAFEGDGTIGESGKFYAFLLKETETKGSSWLEQDFAEEKWASSTDIRGYNTVFKELCCTPEPTDASASSASFSGDTDGSDNYLVIKRTVKDSDEGYDMDYPAFAAAEENTGFYLASIAEMCAVYKNIDKINSAIETVEKALEKDIPLVLDGKTFWTSSIKYLDMDLCEKALCVEFSGEGVIKQDNKAKEHSVLPIKPFSPPSQ